MSNRRQFLQTAAAVGAVSVLPFQVMADGHSANEFATSMGTVTVHPIAHASIILETPVGVIYIDPVGDPALYAEMPAADLVLITHHHGDHLNNDTLAAVLGDAPLISNAGAQEKMTGDAAGRAEVIANGETTTFKDMGVEAIAAYNTTAERMKFHPQGRDNGYVLTIGDFRIYISADTEGVPEMRALKDIDLAFVCMNLPFTMDVEAAADAVAAFKPKVVYPYHYRGKDGGTQDPAAFAALMSDAIEVKMAAWY